MIPNLGGRLGESIPIPFLLLFFFRWLARFSSLLAALRSTGSHHYCGLCGLGLLYSLYFSHSLGIVYQKKQRKSSFIFTFFCFFYPLIAAHSQLAGDPRRGGDRIILLG